MLAAFIQKIGEKYYVTNTTTIIITSIASMDNSDGMLC